MNVALQDGLDDAAEINGFLTDPRDLVFLGIECFQKFGHGRKTDFLELRGEISIDPHRYGAVTHGSAAAAVLFLLVINAGGERAALYRVHQTAEFFPERSPVFFSHGRCAAVIAERRAVAQFLGHLCGDPRICGKQELGGRNLLAGQNSVKSLPCLGQRIPLASCIGDKIRPSRQDFPDGTYQRGDVLDAVDDLFVFIQEDQVAVFAHQLDDQCMPAQIPHFIQVFHLKAEDALETGLRHGQNAPVLQMFAQKHAESRCL